MSLGHSIRAYTIEHTNIINLSFYGVLMHSKDILLAYKTK